MSAIFMISLSYVPLPERKDAIFKTALAKGYEILSDSCGSVPLSVNGKCYHTDPSMALLDGNETEWCSNIPEGSNWPWVSYRIKGKGMKVYGFSVRNGCCWSKAICFDDGNASENYFCCRLFGYSLHGSNDNKSWVRLNPP